jgi:hypothetical protein
MTLQEISDLLDTKLDAKLKPISDRLEAIESRLTAVEEKLDNVLAFVAVGNEDLAKKLPKLKKVAH